MATKPHTLDDPEISIEVVDFNEAWTKIGSPEQVTVEFEPGDYPILVLKGIGQRIVNPNWPDQKPRYIWRGSPWEDRYIRFDTDKNPYVLYRKAKHRLIACHRLCESGEVKTIFKAERINA